MTSPLDFDEADAIRLRALREGHEPTWAGIRREVHESLIGFLRRHRPTGLADPDLEALAEDAAQDALAIVRAKLDSFRGDSRLRTWVHRVGVNCLLGELRRRRWSARRVSPPDGQLPDWPVDGQPTPDRAALQKELWASIKHMVETELTPHQRRVLIAHVFEEQPLDLLAVDLGISRDAVYKAIHDARRKLRAALLASGVKLGDALKAFEKESP